MNDLAGYLVFLDLRIERSNLEIKIQSLNSHFQPLGVEGKLKCCLFNLQTINLYSGAMWDASFLRKTTTHRQCKLYIKKLIKHSSHQGPYFKIHRIGGCKSQRSCTPLKLTPSSYIHPILDTCHALLDSKLSQFLNKFCLGNVFNVTGNMEQTSKQKLPSII